MPVPTSYHSCVAIKAIPSMMGMFIMHVPQFIFVFVVGIFYQFFSRILNNSFIIQII